MPADAKNELLIPNLTPITRPVCSVKRGGGVTIGYITDGSLRCVKLACKLLYHIPLLAQINPATKDCFLEICYTQLGHTHLLHICSPDS